MISNLYEENQKDSNRKPRAKLRIRVMRTCRELDLESVAVYSEADRTSLHVRYAHEAYCVGKAPSSESYLNVDKIIEVAKQSGADAIHPGYGFLSENAEFCPTLYRRRNCFYWSFARGYRSEWVIKFRPRREAMTAAGIPVVPGTDGEIKTEQEALEVIKTIGLPVMIKASAGWWR